MLKVNIITTPLKIFHAKEELEEWDSLVNRFLEDGGATIGIIRALAYE